MLLVLGEPFPLLIRDLEQFLMLFLVINFSAVFFHFTCHLRVNFKKSLLKYNWHVTLCELKVYSMIWYVYVLLYDTTVMLTPLPCHIIVISFLCWEQFRRSLSSLEVYNMILSVITASIPFTQGDWNSESSSLLTITVAAQERSFWVVLCCKWQ